jgi:hypothetical protein
MDNREKCEKQRSNLVCDRRLFLRCGIERIWFERFFLRPWNHREVLVQTTPLIDWLISPQRKRRLLGYWDWVWKNISEGKFGMLRVFIGWENGTRSPRYFLECPNFFRWRGSFLALQFFIYFMFKKTKK